MNDEEKKAWEEMLEVARRNLSMPIADERFRMAQQIFLAADAELTRLRAEAERLRADLRAATQELMDLAHSKPHPVEFTEDDGTMRRIVWDNGDESVGIPARWVPDDDYGEKVSALRATVARVEDVEGMAKVLFHPYVPYCSSCEKQARAVRDYLKEGR